jgi:hypothetical protein
VHVDLFMLHILFFLSPRWESLAGADALNKPKRPRVVVHTTDWVDFAGLAPTGTAAPTSTAAAQASTAAMAVALALVQRLGAALVGIDELVYYAPTAGNQAAYVCVISISPPSLSI